jgi:Flp pilus assembly protein TadD
MPRWPVPLNPEVEASSLESRQSTGLLAFQLTGRFHSMSYRQRQGSNSVTRWQKRVVSPTIENAKLQYPYQQALAFYREGRPRAAEAICKRLLAKHPGDFDALHLLGVSRFQLGKLPQALAAYDKALLIRPNSAELLSNRGVALRDLGRFEEALASYELALSVDPASAAVLNNHGVVLRDLKRLNEALASHDLALAVKQDYVEAINNQTIGVWSCMS